MLSSLECSSSIESSFSSDATTIHGIVHQRPLKNVYCELEPLRCSESRLADDWDPRVISHFSLKVTTSLANHCPCVMATGGLMGIW